MQLRTVAFFALFCDYPLFFFEKVVLIIKYILLDKNGLILVKQAFFFTYFHNVSNYPHAFVGTLPF